MERKRTIVSDVDDTISVTVNRDYANAIPIQPVIDKLNRLYDEGWHIIYSTARGQLSANFDLDKINKTRKPVLEKWLKENGVKYHELIMGKPFADYYLDDKAMLPEQFLSEDFGLKMEGRSGADVSRVGNLVMKVCANAQMQVDWYANCPEGVLIPKVTDSAPSVYRMEYIKENSSFSDSTARDLIKAVELFMDTPCMDEYQGEFMDYAKYCVRKLPKAFAELILMYADDWEVYCQARQSFCHGDLTLTNCIHTKEGTVFIDPSVQKGVWNSWLIDIGRIFQSLFMRYEEKYLGHERIYSKDFFVPYIREHFHLPEPLCYLMTVLIYARIWHHQVEHSEEDGKKTMEDLTWLLKKLGEASVRRNNRL